MRKPSVRSPGSRLVNFVLTAVLILIFGIVFVTAAFLLYQRRYALDQADDLLLYDATLLSQSIDATLEITDLVLKNIAADLDGTESREVERRSLSPAIFSIPGAENIYLLDGEGRILFSVIQRRDPSLSVPATSLDRLKAGAESEYLILYAPAEGGKALVLIRVLKRSPVTRYAAVLFTRFEVQQRFTALAPRSGSRFSLTDREGNSFMPGAVEADGSPVQGGPGDASFDATDLMRVSVALANRPVTLQYFTDRDDALNDWGFRALIQAGTVFLFICLVVAILIFGLYQYGRALRTERLEQELRTQEALFREVHHRTKNNLATIQAVLSFALRDVPSDSGPASYALKTSISRIGSISLIHDLLHGSAAKTDIDLTAYVTKLVSTIGGLYAQNVRIGIRTDIQPGLLMPYENAMTCGMIINELVTNSYKYAFPGDVSGTITVECARDPEGLLGLTVSDDGIGFGNHPRSGTGMDLVRMLAEKLGAEPVRGENVPSGTIWRFTFAA